jgi:hypothetical protein
MAKWSDKDPQDVRFYWMDLRPLGLAPDETITSVTAISEGQLDPDPSYDLFEVLSAEPTLEDQWVVALFSGGSPGSVVINYTAETSAGQTLNVEKTLKIKERKQ